MRALVQGLAFGMLLQLSVGPVCLAVIGEAVSRGLRRALAMVVGVVLVDGAYVALAATGAAALLRLETARLLFGVFGAVTLVAFGLRFILMRPPARGEGGGGARGALLLGVALTAGSPLTILFWIGAFGSLVASGRVGGGLALLEFATGCVAATLLFLGAVAWAAHRLAPLLSPRVVIWLHRGVGLALVGLAAKLLLDVVAA